MTRKPKGSKYRGLYVYRGRIWYERRIGERRFRENTGIPANAEDPWALAVEWRDEYERARGIASGEIYTGAMPTFASITDRYLAEDVAHLAATTRTDRASHLKPEGPVLRHLGEKPLDQIKSSTLREWWNAEIQGAGRSTATGHRYLASIAGVLNYALELEYVRENPVDTFRRQLSRRRRSKAGRTEQTSKANPIEDAESIKRLVAEARKESVETAALVLVLLDAGLRLGEALALRWRRIAWGSDETDPRRHLLIEASFSRDSHEETAPKSGRKRSVQISKRLRRALGDLYLSQTPRPGRDALVFEIEPRPFREGAWARISERAGLPGRSLKDLRDTFGSQLVSAGIPLLYVSRQLGHSTTAVTERHYAKWIPGGGVTSHRLPTPAIRSSFPIRCKALNLQ